MHDIDEEKILNESPDFENQTQILEEERKVEKQKKKWYVLMLSIFLFIVVIFVISYGTVYVYREYKDDNPVSDDPCDNVDVDDDDKKPGEVDDDDKKDNGQKIIINETDEDSCEEIHQNGEYNITGENKCIPVYNIDYFNNRKATFNIDIFGDKSFLFNRTNQYDPTGTYCIINCDSNKDGWPDYNIDLDGDGTIDVNIVTKPWSSTICDLDCDIDFDMIPDTNIDTDGDGKADINISNGNYDMPFYNIDYMGSRTAVFNLNNGTVNKVVSVKNDPYCKFNCDINDDGWPEYNIKLTEDSEVILNELIKTDGTTLVHYDLGKKQDYKCFFYRTDENCKTDKIAANTYINIDVNGDGIPDVNLSTDKGETLTNAINKTGKYNGNTIIMNYDVDNDGFPDYNIDIDNDNVPDLNIVNSKLECTDKCDTNGDGKADYNAHTASLLSKIYNINIDIDYDGICDTNCDTDSDLVPNLNIDLNNDNSADINIDFNYDGVADFNIDTDGDGIPDKNLDAYSLGVCNFNCGDEKTNPVNTGETCTINCDTNADGWPDKNVDINSDGICDFNCDGNDATLDNDNNYYLDSEALNESTMLTIDTSSGEDFYIMSPLEIKDYEIEPGWSKNYIISIKNNSKFAVSYKLIWTNVTNEFSDENNIDYMITRNKTEFLNSLKTPREETIITGEELIIKGNTSIRYVMPITWAETGLDQNVDSGKVFKGQLKVEVIK